MEVNFIKWLLENKSEGIFWTIFINNIILESAMNDRKDLTKEVREIMKVSKASKIIKRTVIFVLTMLILSGIILIIVAR